MCGIVGFLNPHHDVGAQELQDHAERMADALHHRGPDHGGVWVDEKIGLALGHRRLSIQDISLQGHQPMLSSCGRFVMVLNGEIYNFQELREELESQYGPLSWRGHSDTEILLEVVRRLGVVEAVDRTVGMFAFALWDRETRELTLVRDRMGEKPLYYGWSKGVFLFGSELKALRRHPAWQGEIDRGALALFMRHNCVPAPHSIYSGIKKLRPGSFLRLRMGDGDDIAEYSNRYWSMRDVAERGTSKVFQGSEQEAIEKLDWLLRRSIRQQMIADVPLGAFLSGGIDSSTIVALMQAQSPRPIKTFTIGFCEKGYNEAEHAAAVARHLGTDHTELYLTAQEALSVIPQIPMLYDEPFSDSSQIPTFLVAQLARRHVTVSLSGDGGDELFGGYQRYFLGNRIWKGIGWMPQMLRNGLSKSLRAVPSQHWDLLTSIIRPLIRSRRGKVSIGDKLHKLAEVLIADSPAVLYWSLISHWKQPKQIVLGADEPYTNLTDRGQWATLAGFTEMMMYLDAVSYLPDDILVKIDRACMGVSLESRIPLLDHRLVEFVWSLPRSFKVRNKHGKWLLRQVLHRYVPRNLIERPKMGFGVPIDSWLRGPLREWAEELLQPERLRREGYFDERPITRMWAEHKSRSRNWQYYLWDVLMFQAWFEQLRAS